MRNARAAAIARHSRPRWRWRPSKMTETALRRRPHVARSAQFKGSEVGRWHASSLMRRMGIEALGRKPNLNKKHPMQPTFPYGPHGMNIEPDQPGPGDGWHPHLNARGFLFLRTELDRHHRKVLAHGLASTKEADFRGVAQPEAIAKYRPHAIMNTDQGSPFTGAEFIGELRKYGIMSNLDGRGPWRDNALVQRRRESVTHSAAGASSADCPPRWSCARRKPRPPAAEDNPASRQVKPQRIQMSQSSSGSKKAESLLP